MPKNKKQHYVPVFYLKRFSLSGKHIGLWNMESQKKILSANLRNQCYEDYSYGKNNEVENILADIEGETSNILNNINCFDPYNSDKYEILLLYIITQFFRSKYTWDEMNELYDKLSGYFSQFSPMEEGIPINDFVNITKAHRETIPEDTVMMAFFGFRYSLDLDMKLLINRTETEFITSDNPVILYNQLLSFMTTRFGIPGSRTGLNAKGLQIFFPISSSELLFFYDSNSYYVGNRKNTTIPITQEKDVLCINTLQMCSAHENVYFKNDFPIEDLHNLSSPYMRSNKSNLNISTDEDLSGDLLHSSRVDINTNLRLSFISLTREGKKTQRDIKRKIKNGLDIPICPSRIADHTP